jgi:sugar (pentulose or hexulose) kinase
MIKPGLSTIAIDIGSTSIKGALIEPDSGELVRCIKRPFPEPLSNLPPGHVEVDPSVVVQAVRSVLLELSEQSSGHCSVWVCGQMGGVVLADDKGRAKSNYISWRDQRASGRSSNGRSFLETIRLDWPEPVFAALGRELQPGSTSALLHCLSESRKLVDGVLPLSIADYCISHLTQQPGCMHPTHAIGLLDLNKLDWHYAALERIGLGDLWLPELIHHTHSVGRYCEGGKIFDFHGSYGDQQCALYGSGLSANELSINVSTGSQVSILTDQFQSGPYQTRCYFHGKWLNTITHLPAGRALNAWVDLLSELAEEEGKPLDRVWDTIAKKMEQVSHTDLQTELSLFPSPAGSTGSLSNITLENLNVGNLFLAACTSMVDNYFLQSQRLSSKEPWQSIVVSGGLGASLPKFFDLIRLRFQRTVRESSGEETLLGLARLASHTSSQQ